MADRWNWPKLNGAPAHNTKETYSEFFDTDTFDHVDTLVREAIQNSLDARLDKNHPIRVEFSSGECDNEDFLGECFSSLESFRKKCDRIKDVKFKKIRWLKIQDSNTTGLTGKLNTQENSNFWKFWLEFGQGSKPEKKLGRHGVGRISLILASEVHTIIGVSKREEENEMVSGGISLLDPMIVEGKKRASAALFFKEFLDDDDVWKLHSEDEDFMNRLSEAFQIDFNHPGFAAFILFPHEEITFERIKAAVVEHFSSSIMTGKLVVNVGGDEINADNLLTLGNQVKNHFRIRHMSEDWPNYFNLLKAIHHEDTDHVITLEKPKRIKDITIGEEIIDKCRNKLEDEGKVVVKVAFKLHKKGEPEGADVSISVGFSNSGQSGSCVESYHRSGMAIPNGGGQLQLKGKITSAICADDTMLADLLNISEGKAHLSWQSAKKIKEELNEKYEDGFKVRNLCALALKDFYERINKVGSEPDRSVWSNLFNAPTEPEPVVGPIDVDTIIDGPLNPTYERVPKLYLQETIEGKGFRVSGGDASRYDGTPRRLVIKVGYKRTTGDPFKFWDETDFHLNYDRMVNSSNCISVKYPKGNQLELLVDREDFEVSVTGFDPNREIKIYCNELK